MNEHAAFPAHDQRDWPHYSALVLTLACIEQSKGGV